MVIDISLAIFSLIALTAVLTLFFLYQDLRRKYSQLKLDADIERTKAKLDLQIEQGKNPITNITYWLLEKYTDDDIKTIALSWETLNAIIKVFAYMTAKETDLMRVPDNFDKLKYVLWRVNAMNEMFLFFHKIKSITNTKKE